MRSALYRENGDPRGPEMYAEWEEVLVKAVRAADRNQEDYRIVPPSGIMQTGWDSGYGMWQGIGAAWPFGPQPFG
jgi:hypothetical protein